MLCVIADVPCPSNKANHPVCDQCATGFFGPLCAACPNCGSHGVCEDSLVGSGACRCDDSWQGAACSEQGVMPARTLGSL
jgi:hypothetical protein